MPACAGDVSHTLSAAAWEASQLRLSCGTQLTAWEASQLTAWEACGGEAWEI